MNNQDRLASIAAAIERTQSDDSDEELCASFKLAGQETPWAQLLPGVLNIWWPFHNEDAMSRVGDLPLAPPNLELEEVADGVFAAFAFDMISSEKLAAFVDVLFQQLYGCEADYRLDTETYAVQNEEIPEQIPVAFRENSPTQDIGRYGQGNQFMGFVVATFSVPIGETWERHKRWHAVLHTFDSEGEHLNTDSWFAGISADGEEEVIERAQKRLQEMIAQLGSVERGDVAVCLFATEVDAQDAGLFDTTWEDEEGAVYVEATLLPNDLVFSDPWDGSYQTPHETPH